MRPYQYILGLCLFLAACGAGTDKPSSESSEQADTSIVATPDISTVALTDSIDLAADDNMHFDKDIFKIKKGKPVTLTLTNTGSLKGMAMTHNVVILQSGTNLETFAEEARKFKATGYIPVTLKSPEFTILFAVIRGIGEQCRDRSW
jgi:azurin